jgi:hypothetical protein
MTTISNAQALRARILLLEQQRKEQEIMLKQQAQLALDSIKPGNMLSHAMHQPEVKDKMVSAGLGLLTGYLSKRLLLGPAAGPVSKIAGDVLQWGVAAISGSKAEAIKNKVGGWLQKVKFKKGQE